MHCLDVEQLQIGIHNIKTTFASSQAEYGQDRYPERHASRTALVHNVSFSIGEHETLAVIGESGSGKTLTALAVMGLLDRSFFSITGRCSFFGTDLLQLSERERKRYCLDDIAMIYQNPFRSLSPVETMRTHLRAIYRLKRKTAHQSFLQTLFAAVHLNMDDMLHKYPHECSGGELQRMMIVFALLFKPRLLICDEPSTALDYQTGTQIIELLNTMKEQTGMSMLFITHDISLVKDIADKIIIMKDGGIIEMGTAKSVLTDSQHAYTRMLIEAAYLKRQDRCKSTRHTV